METTNIGISTGFRRNLVLRDVIESLKKIKENKKAKRRRESDEPKLRKKRRTEEAPTAAEEGIPRI
jgi:hypothetical protein